jgi:ribosomal protein L12E/L44/L45/RPP1/RPP2
MALEGGGKSKAGDVRAGGAFVEISAKDKLSGTLTKLKARAEAFAAGLKTIGTKTALLGGAALAPMLALFKGGVDRAERIDQMSKSMGIAADEMQRLAYAADVAGVSIDDVLDNPGRFKGLMADAPIMDAATLRDSVRSQQEFRKAMIGLQTAAAPLVQAITPIIVQVGEFIKNNKGLVQTLLPAAAGVMAFGMGMRLLGGVIGPVISIAARLAPVLLSPFSVARGVVGGAISGVRGLAAGFWTVIRAAGPMALRLAGPIGAIATLGIVAYRNIPAFAKMVDGIGAKLGELVEIGSETFDGLVAAISRGDLSAAWKVTTAGLYATWAWLGVQLTDVWHGFKQGFGEAVAGLELMWTDFATGVSKIWNYVIGGAKSAFMTYIQFITKAAAEVVDLVAPETAGKMKSWADALKTDFIADAKNKNKALEDERNAERKKILDDLAADDANRMKDREDAMGRASKELADARAELAQAVAAAKAPGGGPAAEALADLMPRIASVRGSFGAFGADQRFFDERRTDKDRIPTEQLRKLEEAVEALVKVREDLKAVLRAS